LRWSLGLFTFNTFGIGVLCTGQKIYFAGRNACYFAGTSEKEHTVTAAKKSFIYFDPPYRPLSQTAGFTAYSQNSFDDKAQILLAQTFKSLDAQGVKLMLSNSNPKNVDKQDNFFETQYADFHIQTVLAHRMINSVATKRGKITELLITNY